MARRGRFGRSETGASNLSATIASLVRQQKQEEERALLEAYYSEIPYAGGSIPTLQDIINFYRDSASLSGINEGTEEYQAIFQKINDVTNYDINRQYGDLIKEFNATKGSNYEQIIEFISGRGQTSTNQDDLAEFAEAIDSTTTAFLRYKGEALKKREISPKEYQSLTMAAIQVLDPGSEAYNTAVYDAFTYEWAAQSEIWGNKLKAGLISESKFASLSKSLAERMLASGIDKNSGLYTGVLASIATAVGSGGGSSVANKRIGRNTGKLARAYLVAAAATGVGDPGDLEDLEKNPSKVNEYIAANPEIWLLYDEYLIANPGATNLLVDAGIDVSSPEDFKNWRESRMDRIQADYAISGNQDGYDEVTRAIKATGRGSVEDDFSYASNKRNTMLAEATNPIDQTYIRNQWKMYLNGQSSKLFGTIPGGDPKTFALALARSSQYLVTLYQNELNKADGIATPEGSITLSGKYDNNRGELNIDNDWQYDGPSQIDATALSTGLGVWSTANGGEVVPPSSGGFEAGTYQQVTFGKSLDGSLTPFVREIYGNELYKTGEAGKEVIGWVYDVDGLTVATDLEGRKINLPVALEANKWVIDGDKKNGATEPRTIGVIDTSVISTPALLRSVSIKITGDSANGIPGLLTTGNFTQEQVNTISDSLSKLQTAANLRQAKQLQTLPNLSPQQRKQIYELQGVDTSQWDQYVGRNLDKYEEVSPGIWKLKPEISKKQSERGPFSFIDLGPGIGAGINALNVQNLPDTIDIRTTEMKNSQSEVDILTTIATIGQGLLPSVFGGLTKPSLEKEETPGGVFFRNMNQFRAGEREPLNIQIPKTLPKPIIPEAPTVNVFTPQQINKAFVDFRAGERAPLNIKKEPSFTTEKIDQSLIDFRAGERNI
jgi:hypothetical protein